MIATLNSEVSMHLCRDHEVTKRTKNHEEEYFCFENYSNLRAFVVAFPCRPLRVET